MLINFEFSSNMMDVVSYDDIYYVTKRYILFCPNTQEYTVICVQSIN